MATYFRDPSTGALLLQRDDGSVVPAVPIASRPGAPTEVTQGANNVDAARSARAPLPLTQSPPGPLAQPGRAGGGNQVAYDLQGSQPTLPPSANYAPRSPSGGGSPDGMGARDAGVSGGASGGIPQLAGLGDRIRAANGVANGETGGFRDTIYSPSGAGAGPFGASAPHHGLPSGGGDYGGGGGNVSPLYSALRAKGNALEAKVRGMASGIASGGSSYDSGGSSYSSYSSGPSYAQPPEPRMRGLAKGMDPTQAASLSLRPTMLLPDLFPGMGGAEPLYANLSALPAAQLGMLAKKGFDGGPSDLVNGIGRVYQDAATNNNLPDFEDAMRNLTSPKHGGGIDTMFSGEKMSANDQESYTAPGYVYGNEPPTAADAAYTYAPFLDAALSLLPAQTAAKYGSSNGGYGGYLMDKFGSHALNKAPGKGTPINTYVGRRLMR